MNDENRLYHTLHQLRFFSTPPHECGYLDDEEATTLFVDPRAPMNMATYQVLSELGFRRSGEHVYRPHCRLCRACVPVRLPVARFRPNRSQRRCLARNRDLELTIRPAGFDPAHFALYRRYMQARHPGGGMDNDDPEAYTRMIRASWADTALYEFRLADRLLAVAVVDQGPNFLSAVYTYYEPDAACRSLGVYAVLQEIEQARRSGRDWLYLGFWNPATPKMRYKAHYAPLEYFDGSHWKNSPPSLTVCND